MLDSLDRKDSLYDKEWVNGYQKHLLGAIGEVAVSKFLNQYLPGDIRQFHGMDSDIGGIVEVRHRRTKGHQLIVRDDDPDDRVYILSRGVPPDAIEIAGCICGKDAKREEFVENHGEWGKAYFVPDDELQSTDILRSN